MDLKAICEDNRRRVATAIKCKRAELRISQNELAAMSGVARRTISRVESGDISISLDNLSALMAALGIKMEIE